VAAAARGRLFFGMTSQLIQRAQLAFERKEYASALETLQAVLQEKPGFADVRHLAGLCLGFLGRSEEAVEQIDLALQVNPRYVEAHVSRALLLQDLGRYGDAREAFQSASHFEREDHGRFPAAVTTRLANAHADLGDLYMAAGTAADAAAQYASALELRPLFHDIRSRYAAALLQLDMPDQACKELQAVLQGNPLFLAARLNLGLAYYRLGRIDEAAAEWRACATQQPDNPQVRAYVALLEKQGVEDPTD
jgi:tetratricopeptide (TPR) repeat protein